MRFGQIRLPNGDLHAFVAQGSRAIDIADTARSLTTIGDYFDLALARGVMVRDAIEQAAGRGGPTYDLDTLLAGEADKGARLAIPLTPRDAWGCGVTYKRSAEFRDQDASGGVRGIYDYVYSAARPETFYKGGAAHAVGPYDAIGIRRDSTYTAPEPELALILDRCGTTVGLTCANDVSAWDIERENPLYLPQSKVFRGCLAIGPVIVTPDEVGDGTNLDLRCRIVRDGAAILDGGVNTSRIGRSLDELIEYLTRDNPIGNGTVLCTGTGVIAEREHALRSGDRVEIDIAGIGLLVNLVERLV
ncbi:MAG: 2-keto-3-deoxy-D-arabinonate dehydratase [Chloroflexi bacterium]|nr:2-keto-3-deoxy-D-arabinonate dehydratase [Chloroflexota bacterium]